MSLLHNFHFARPLWLLALVPWAIMFFGLWHKKVGVSTQWESVCDAHLLKHLLVKPQGKQTRRLPFFLLFFSVLLSIIALAGPLWQRLPLPLFRQDSNVVVVLDLSLAMDAVDLKPSRLARARYKLQDLLQQRRQGNTGLVVFAKEAYTVSPLTSDTQTIMGMVQALKPAMMPVQGNNIAVGLAKAAQLLAQAHDNGGHIILFTASPVNDAALAEARQLRALGITLSILGFGTAQGSPIKTSQGFLQDKNGGIIVSKLDEAKLALLAQAAGGVNVHFSNDNKDIEQLLTSIDSNNHFENSGLKQKVSRWRDEGYWLVFPLLLLGLLAFRSPWFEEITQ